MDTPQQKKRYQCHHFDSTRWNYYRKRQDDIIIATSYKAGTTWTQGIIANLLFPDGKFPAPPAVLSPWLDLRLFPLEMVLNDLEEQSHRRFIKTHLPFDGMRYESDVKYVYISRDGRDVFMSLWNHYRNMTDEGIALMNGVPGLMGETFPSAPDDIHSFWETWVSQSLFENEVGGWPFWSHLSNVQSWWDQRNNPNIALFHYADLLNDTEAEIGRLADYLEIDVPAEHWPRILEAISFNNMREQGEQYAPGGGAFWKGGANTFMNKGTNGRWRGELSDDELSEYEKLCNDHLSVECKQWLERGRDALL